MKRVLLALLIALIFAGVSFAQSTTVSGQVTDAGSQAWNNGTITAVFVVNPQYPTLPQYTWTGGTLNSQVSGTLNATGAYSLSIPSNSAISPVNSQWRFQVCPQASSPCFYTNPVTITGATQTVNVTPPAILINLATAVPPISAYSTSEVTGAVLGSTFYLLGTGTQVCSAVSGNTCTTWVSGGGIPSVTSLPATCTPGTTGPVNLTINGIGYGVFYCSGTNAWTPDNPQGTISPLAYGAKADVKFVYDAATTLNSNTVTCPQNDCNFTSADLGKIVFGTTSSNIASSLNGSLVLPQGFICTINSTSSIAVGTTFPGCAADNATATCTASGSTLCPLAWGTQDDATAINNAMTAAWGTNKPGPCVALQLPSATMFIGSAILGMTIAQLSGPCGGSLGNVAQSGIDTTQTGPEVYGQGPANSVLIPLPSFSFASCTTNGGVCVGGTPNMEAHDFGLNGLGQDNAGSPQNVTVLKLVGSNGGGACTGNTGFNLTFANWLARSSTSVGISFGVSGCGDPVYSNIVSEMLGATNCFVQGSLTTALYGVACFGASTQVLQLSCSGNQIINSYYGEYLDQDAAGPTVSQGGCVFNSWGDNIAGQFSGATTYQFTGAVVTQANFFGSNINMSSGTTSLSNVFFLNGPAGSTAHFRDAVVNGTGANNRTFVTSAGNSIFDEGGNAFTNGSQANSIAGSFVADGHSIQGACTGVATAASTLGLYGTGTNITATTCTAAVGSGQVMSKAGTLQFLIVSATAAGTNASSGVVTVLKNGGATTLTCTIGTGTSCSDVTHTATFAIGDLISIQFTTQAADTLAGVKAFVEWN